MGINGLSIPDKSDRRYQDRGKGKRGNNDEADKIRMRYTVSPDADVPLHDYLGFTLSPYKPVIIVFTLSVKQIR